MVPPHVRGGGGCKGRKKVVPSHVGAWGGIEGGGEWHCYVWEMGGVEGGSGWHRHARGQVA